MSGYKGKLRVEKVQSFLYGDFNNIVDETGKRLDERNDANAKELVRRWNCHDKLVEALKDLYLALQTALEAGGETQIGVGVGLTIVSAKEKYHKALAEAEKDSDI